MPRWRVRGVGKKDYRRVGIGIPISVDPGTNFPITNTFDLMAAIKYNLMVFSDKAAPVVPGRDYSDILRKDKISWKTGFIFMDTVLPAVTVFPLSKIFHPRRGGGWQYVEYRYTIDIYSKRRADLYEAKRFCLEAVDDVVDLVKSRQRMIDANGYAHCFRTRILGTRIFEPRKPADRGFVCKASVNISCTSWHRMNQDRVFPDTATETGYEVFFDTVVSTIGGQARSDGVKAKQWIDRLIQPIKFFPAVIIMPEDESMLEIFSNETAMLERPVRFQVVSRGIPKIDILEHNMDIADDLVDIVEEFYALGGYAEDCEIKSIEYFPEEGGLVYSSVIDVVYRSKKVYEAVNA